MNYLPNSRVFERESNKHLLLKLFSFIFLFVLFFFVSNTDVSAATYYVATTGNDSYTTTQAQNPATPWLTLSGAQTNAANGDTINVAAGTYKHASTYTNFTKTITWNANGTVIVQSATSETVRVANFASFSPTNFITINGFTFDGEGAKSICVAIGGYNVVFNNVTFKNATTTMVNHASSVGISINSSTFTMLPTSTAMIISGTSGDVVLQNSTFNFPSGSAGIINKSATTGTLTFTGNTLNGTTSGNVIYATGGSNIYLNNNDFNITGLIGTILLTSGGTGTLEIKNNTVDYTKSSNETFFLSGGSYAADIDGNIITSTDSTMVMAVLSINNQVNTIIQNNTIDSLATADRGQIFVRSTGTDMGTLQIRGNTLRSRSSLFIINIGTDTPNAGSGKINGAIIENNNIYGPVYFNPALTTSGCHGIFYSQNQNGILRYNNIYGAGYGFVVKGTGETHTSGGIYYNKIINSSSAGTAIRIKGAKGVPVYNNTIYSDSTLTSPLIYVTNYNPDVGQEGGAIVKNNILYCQNCRAIDVDEESAPNFISDHNLIYRDTGNDIGVVGLTTYSSFSSWQSAGYDVNGVNSNPYFVNVATSDFRFLPTSLAINLGSDLGFTRDLVNTSVPQGLAPDTGAYEFWTPSVGSGLYQYKSDGSTAITTGDLSDTTTVILKFTMSSANASDLLTPQVEVQPIGTTFTNTVTNSGTAVSYSGSGVTGTVTVTGLSGGNYHWQARTTNPAGSGAWTSYDGNAESETDFSIDSTAPTTPINLTISTATNNSRPSLNWTASSDSGSGLVNPAYTLQYSTDSNFVNDVSSVTTNTNSYTFVADLRDSTWYFRVKATDIAGNDSGYGTANITINTISPNTSSSICTASQPTGIVPWIYSVVSNNSNSINLSFANYQTPITHFTLEYGTEQGKYIYSVDNISKDTARYTVNSLAPNTTYYFRIRTGNDCAVGTWSNELSTKTKGLASINLLDITDSEIKVTPIEKKTNKDEVMKEQIGYEVNIKVLNSDKEPVKGAKVTLHSDPKETTTDVNGIAHFTDVEKGDHKVFIAYKNFEGEQSINLTGDVKEFNINVTVTEKRFSISPFAWWIIGGLSSATIFLVIHKRRVLK